MNAHAPKNRSGNRVVMLIVFVVAIAAIAIAFIPQRRSESLTIEMLTGETGPADVFINGTRMGTMPVTIAMDEVFSLSKPEHVPATWSPNSLTVTSANHTRSGHSVHAGIDLTTPVVPGQPRIIVVRRDGSDPSDVQMAAIEVVVRAADGTEWRPETVGASILSFGPRWSADLRVIFGPPPAPVEP